MGEVLTLEALQNRLAPIREQSVLVTTNGCFDILHVGHLRYLQEARRQGDLLIVFLNTDRSVQALKGPTRPFVPEDERAELLAALNCVDYVVLFDEDTPLSLIEAIRPNIHVKGAQYTTETLPEAPLLAKLGVQIYFAPMIAGRSTTDLVSKVQAVTCPSS